MYASTLEAPVLLIGSAHVVDLDGPMRRLLGERVVDAMAVELDADRAATVLAEEARPSGTARGGPFFVRLWGILQRRLGEDIGGGIAGAEMRTAARLAKERSIPLFLIDDPIRETLQNLIRSMSVRERISLLLGAVVGVFLPTRYVERQIDRYTESPADYLEEVRRAYPSVARVLLDDRNEHMAGRLGELRGRGYGRVVAVVGDAHLSGLADALKRRGIPVETVSLGTLMSTDGAASGPAPGSS